MMMVMHRPNITTSDDNQQYQNSLQMSVYSLLCLINVCISVTIFLVRHLVSVV